MIHALPHDADSSIRRVLTELGFKVGQRAKTKLTQFVPAGGRDIALTSIAGTFASAVTRGERTLLEAIGQVRSWAENFTERVSGDSVSPDKAQQKLIEFVARDNQNGRALPAGWDEGLDDEVKDALGLSGLACQRANSAYDLNDTGNARRFADRFRGQVRFEVDRGIWRIWSGMHWEADKTRAIERMAQEVVADIEREANLISDAKTKSKVRAFAKRSGDRARLAAMINLAGAETGISCVSTDFDNVPGFLPVLNGVIDLNSGALLAHDPARFITRLVRHQFVGGHRGARFESVLDRILPDKSVQTLVQRLFGYALHGRPVEQRFTLFQGRGANGKSVLLDTTSEVVREWVVKTSSSTFLQKDNESTTRPDLVRLQGSRIVIGGETPSRRKLDATTVKALTGDREMTARPLYLADVTFRLSFVPFMVSNPLPPGDEEDRALWRRLLLIPFDVVIPEEERDQHLVETLVKDESEAILAWLVQGAIDYAKHGLLIPDIVKERTAEWRRNVGSIERFLLETWQPEQAPQDSHSIGLSLLHDEYQRWCYSRSIHPKGIESFRSRADELGYQFKDTAKGETIFGVRGRKPAQETTSGQGGA